jgi:hypothetical protein
MLHCVLNEDRGMCPKTLSPHATRLVIFLRAANLVGPPGALLKIHDLAEVGCLALANPPHHHTQWDTLKSGAADGKPLAFTGGGALLS